MPGGFGNGFLQMLHKDQGQDRSDSTKSKMVRGTNRKPQHHTTRIERCLLMMTIVLVPLQDHIPSIAGFSVLWFLFGILAIYILLNRFNSLKKVCLHPAFCAAYMLLLVGVMTEFSHPRSSYFEILSIAQMFAGAIFVASLCKDRQAVRVSIYAYIIVGVGSSLFFYLTSYGVLSGAESSDFRDASRIRAELYMENRWLEANWNVMAAQIAQGAVAAVALALTTRTSYRRYLYLGIALFCLVGAFLPMSRGGAAMVIISCAVVLLASGAMRGRAILTVAIIGVSMMMLVPDAVWSRMTLSTHAPAGKMEARERVYTAAIEHLPEYVMTGVGVGNFWESWGEEHGFGVSLGAHRLLFPDNDLLGNIRSFGALCSALAGLSLPS